MTIDRQSHQEQQRAAYAAVHDGLGQVPAEFETAGELATLMGRLPAHTPVRIAETVRVDPALPPGAPNVTAAAARITNLLEPPPIDVDNDQVPRYSRVVPGIELAAVIVAEGASVPDQTMAFQPYERAADALAIGDLDVVLDADVKLLTWLADTLVDPPTDEDTVPKWLEDVELRQQFVIEAERLRQSAARLAVLRTRVATYEAAARAEAKADQDRDHD
jgi:hypothetical protein